jgi:hypothetical protein
MAANLQQELNDIANDFTKLYQNEIKKQGLVKTGRLLNSIRVILIKTSTGYKFSVEAVDYFTPLDEKYHISETVFKTREYEMIQERITNVYNLIVIEEITKI